MSRFAEAPDLFTASDEVIDPQPMPTGKLPSYIKDHRKRLRDRFMQGGAAAIPEYELLELVLFRAIRRQDVKPLARRLIDQFGNFSNVLSASQTALQKVEGVGPAVVVELKIVEAAAHRLSRGRVMQRMLFPAGMPCWTTATRRCPTARPSNSASSIWIPRTF